MTRWTSCTILVLGLAAPAAAQSGDETHKRAMEQDILFERVADSGQDSDKLLAEKVTAEKMTLDLQMSGTIRSRVAVEARTTKGAPYSAEATTESTQTLADGNRIVRKSVTRVYRDGDGRTRREELDEAGVVRSISIVDPVAGTSVMLQPDSRTAYGNQSVFVAAGPAGSTTEIATGRGRVLISADGLQGRIENASDGAASAKLAAEQDHQRQERTRGVAPPPPPPPPAPGGNRAVAPPPPPPAPLPGNGGGRSSRPAPAEAAEAGTTTREDLGRQDVEGVAAAGSRITTIIPAGAIGNEQPIKSVSEQWFSPDLQVLVLTKHSDPRQGETTYRLSNIVRAEPDRSLFIVPPDYTMKSSREMRFDISREP
jgi:hypothetical protein